MSATSALPIPQGVSAVPLDDVRWRAWVLKGRTRDDQNHAMRMNAVKWIWLGALLLAATGSSSRFTPLEIACRFAVFAGATVLFFESMRTRRYASAVVLAAVGLFYSPLIRELRLPRGFQQSLAAASAIPLVLSLTSRSGKPVPHV